jgi:hypothetical protein
LTSSLVYRSAAGVEYWIPPGFESDGASVPRLMWWLYPPFGEAYEPATWLHDALYRQAEHYRGPNGEPMTRVLADALLEEASASCGFRASGHHLMHLGVRAGGARTWKRHRAAAALERV